MIPYDKREGKIWYNNELVDWQDVKLHVLSHGLHYASCVFEGLRVYDGEIFKLEDHTDRLFHSAFRMGIEIPYSKDEINHATKKSGDSDLLFSFHDYFYLKNQIPIYEIMSGAVLAFAALLLILPGFATDIIGFLLIFPFTRKLFFKKVKKKYSNQNNKKQDFINGEFEDIDSDENGKV